jgi:transcription factor S
MLFCQKCGSVLAPNPKTKTIKCSCGYVHRQKIDLKIKETIDSASKIEVIDKTVEVLPKTKEECPKCKNSTAFFWTVQTRAGDEAETRFFECTKCRHRWRDYS